MPHRIMKDIDIIAPLLTWIGVTVAITTNVLQGLSFLAIALYTFYKLYLLYKQNNGKNK